MYRFLYFFIIFFVTSAHSKEIAITLDDAPRPDSKLFTGEERTQKLIESLKKVNVTNVLLFVKTINLTEKSKKRLEAYTAAGFYLGNHSHSHFSAHRKDVKTYLADITLAHNQLKRYKNFISFYRYPFLHEGSNRKIRSQIRDHLSSMGYRNGYVTVDNYDWYMDKLLQKALAEGKPVNYTALQKAYIAILWEAISFYDEMAKKAIGRSPKHVLLLHENDIAALYIGELVKHIRAQGWKIISPQEAYEDPIAFTVPDVLYNQQGRVAALAKSKAWDKTLLKHKSESEAYLDSYFKKSGVYK